jgi:hypothetical protein
MEGYRTKKVVGFGLLSPAAYPAGDWDFVVEAPARAESEYNTMVYLTLRASGRSKNRGN